MNRRKLGQSQYLGTENGMENRNVLNVEKCRKKKIIIKTKQNLQPTTKNK